MLMFVDNGLQSRWFFIVYWVEALSIISHAVYDFLEMVGYFMPMLHLTVQSEENTSDISSAFAHVPSPRHQLSHIVILKAAVCGGAEWDRMISRDVLFFISYFFNTVYINVARCFKKLSVKCAAAQVQPQNNKQQNTFMK